MSCPTGQAKTICEQQGTPAFTQGQGGDDIPRNAETWQLPFRQWACWEYGRFGPVIENGTLVGFRTRRDNSFSHMSDIDHGPFYLYLDDDLERSGIDYSFWEKGEQVVIAPARGKRFSDAEAEQIRSIITTRGFQAVPRGKDLSRGFKVVENDLLDLVKAEHRIEVERALLSGKDVPAAVVAEYPELAHLRRKQHLAQMLRDHLVEGDHMGIMWEDDNHVRALTRAAQERINHLHRNAHAEKLELAKARYRLETIPGDGRYCLRDTVTGRVSSKSYTCDRKGAERWAENWLFDRAKQWAIAAINEAQRSEEQALAGTVRSLLNPTSEDWRVSPVLDEMLSDPAWKQTAAPLVAIRLAETLTLEELQTALPSLSVREAAEIILSSGGHVPEEVILADPELILRYGL